MDILEAIYTRKSIRGFLPDPVSRETVEEILAAASRAPSAMNTQPWEFIALSGPALDEIRKENVRCLHEGVNLAPEHLVVSWPNQGTWRDRQVELAKSLFTLMGIERLDKEKRAWWLERGFRYFDAPVAIIVLTDKQLSDSGPLLDVGCMLQNLCLAAMAHGLGTCIEDQGVMYPQVLRKLAGVPDDKRIIMCVALGKPDPDFPANRVESKREPVNNVTSWIGFE